MSLLSIRNIHPEPDPRQIRRERAAESRKREALNPNPNPAKVVEWNEVMRLWDARCRDLRNDCPDVAPFMARVRGHICRKIRLGFADAWFFQGHYPSWLGERASDKDSRSGPRDCYLAAGTLKLAAEECRKDMGNANNRLAHDQVMRQLMAALEGARDHSRYAADGLLRPTRNVIGAHFTARPMPAPV